MRIIIAESKGNIPAGEEESFKQGPISGKLGL
jgi:hypothetical protein